MKVYVSGTYSAQARLRDEAAKLLHLGHEITSTWLHEAVRPRHLGENTWHRRLAEKDIAEVSSRDRNAARA